MSERKDYFASMDDDYLVGLSNKGIVKRAYKDMEKAELTMEELEDVIAVSDGEINCQIKMPLGESECSCPSRSLCKHIVMAALYIKKQYANASEEASSEQADSDNEKNEEATETSHDFSELDSFSMEQIKKKLGNRAFQKVCQKRSVMEPPKITVSSIVTVFFSDTNTTVKLLQPFDYSTCTCHQKDLCVHKAEAIIAYQLANNIITKEQLEQFGADAEKTDYDIEAIRQTIAQMQKLLGEIIVGGIARISPDMAGSCERMAIMCHNQKLAYFENDFRKLSEKLTQYAKKNAALNTTHLMQFTAMLYQKTDMLEKALETGEMEAVAGKMRSQYELSKPLNLMAMGQRHFASQAGYEGDTIYFLEEESGEWYTYTNARPVYYDNARARGKAMEYAAAPWNLNCNLEQLAELRIRLTGGKVNQDNRLSSTSEAVAEITGSRELNMPIVKAQTYDDFAQLYKDKLQNAWKSDEEKEIKRLAIVRAESVGESEFDTIHQVFYMTLLDKNERKIVIRIQYHKNENQNIHYLERIYKRIQKGRRGIPDFFGVLYAQDGELRMYPIAYYDI